MRVLFINLEERVELRDRFLSVNSGIAEFERFNAVDGRLIQQDALIAEGVVAEPLKYYTPPRLGSALSHKVLWERCIAEGVITTIAEDDAVFNEHFSDKAVELLAKLPPDWDIVRWGWNFDSLLDVEVIAGLKAACMTFSRAPLQEKRRAFQQQEFDVLPLRLRNAFGIVCYTVSPQGARRLRDSCFPLRNEAIPIPGLHKNVASFCLDAIMNKYYRNLKSYVCFPPLVWTENYRSDTENAE